MTTIRKYPLDLVPRQVLELPHGTEILHAGQKRNELFLWALVDPDAVPCPRCIDIIGTGWYIEDGPRRHLGTVVMPDTNVWHVFEAFVEMTVEEA
jgi:hypothetical protein